MTDPLLAANGRDQVRAGLTDLLAVTLTIWGEARSEPVLGQIAVASVIRNRVRQARVDRSYRQVCTAPWQFSCWWEGSENADSVFLVATALLGGIAAPLHGADAALLKQAGWIAAGVIAGELVEDVTHGAQHYLTAHLYRSAPPTWAKAMEVVAEIGAHVFLT